MPPHPHQAVLSPVLLTYIHHPLCLENPAQSFWKGLGGMWVIRAAAGELGWQADAQHI